jgi:X-Pro dipeptidyl-peptidase
VKVLVLSSVLVASSLAGCITTSEPLDTTSLERLSQPVFDLARDLVKEPLEVLAPDGARLSTFVYRPATAERVPAILLMSPYFSNGQGRWGVHNQDEQDPPGSTAQIVRYFVPSGYAVVLNSVRGTGFSEGCFTIGGPTESKDHLAVVEAILAQPWSSGAIAPYGGSYVGATAIDLLTEGHPAVKTGVPYAAVSDWYRYNFVNGVPINPQGHTFNFYYERDVAIVPPMAEPGVETVHLAAENAWCDHSEVQRGQFESAVTGDKHAYWQVRDFNAEAGNIRVPVFAIHGLQDWNVKPDHLLPWTQLVAEGVPVKLWLGQWMHNRPNVNSFEEEWTRGDWNVTLLRWFDHFLKGIDTGILQEPLVDVQDDQGTWRREAAWPPSRAAPRTFHLGSGTLEAAVPADGEARWRDLGLALPNPPRDGEAHYALFTSQPLEQDLRISGVGTLHLALAHGKPHGTVAATLWDLAPDGSARRINWGFYDLEHRDSLERGKPVQPGQRFELDIPLFPQDDVVPAGHTLALTLAGHDGPTCLYTTLPLPLVGFPCTPEDGYDDPGPRMGPVPSGGTTTVHTGAASWLTLPTLDAIEPFVPETEQQRVQREG